MKKHTDPTTGTVAVVNCSSQTIENIRVDTIDSSSGIPYHYHVPTLNAINLATEASGLADTSNVYLFTLGYSTEVVIDIYFNTSKYPTFVNVVAGGNLDIDEQLSVFWNENEGQQDTVIILMDSGMSGEHTHRIKTAHKGKAVAWKP
jgi:hypothetical protein